MKSNLIDRFISQLQRRLNLGNALRFGGWMLGGVGILLIIHAAYYRYYGESVPWPTAIGLLALGVIAFIAVWLVKLTKSSDAARVADRELGLKDSLSSSISFDDAHKEGEVYQLQLKTAESLVQNREAKEVPLKYSRGWIVAGLLMTAIAIGMGFLSPSAAVQERMNKEMVTENRTEEIRKEMEKVVEEITRDLSEEEKEVLKPDELKQWVKELKSTKDQKEALRQLARFEQKIAKAMSAMETKKDEESLKLAAFELSKSDQAAARQLGKKLEAKQFKLAAEDLKKTADKAKEKDSKDGAKKNKLNKEQLKKLREMTKRMADAARQRNAGNGKDPKGKMAEGNAKANAKPNGKNMDQMMKELDAAVAEMEMLEGGEMDQADLDEMELMEGDFDQQMKGMQMKLKQLEAKNKMKAKLAGLKAGLGKAQQYAMGKGGTPNIGNNPMAGQGKGIGVGTDESRRKERDKLTNNDQFADLKGQKGSGPSLTAVEDADSGTGISKRNGAASKKRDYQRQLESFVRRDDVPEDVKSGVKEYFEKVHQVQESQK